MTKHDLINVIKRKLSKDYGTLTAAAEAFGIQRANFSRAANGVTEEIPQYLLDYIGYEKEVIYKKQGK